MNLEELQRLLDARNAELHAIHQELSRTNSELMQLTLELDDRVAQRTAELLQANTALEAENRVRLQVENRLRMQAELIDKAKDAIITTNLGHHIIFWNHGAERLLGWTAVEMAGRDIRELFASEPVGAGSSAGHDFTSSGDWQGEISGRHRQGAPLILEASITLLRDEDGQPTGRLIISSDITEKKALEEKILRTQRLETLGMLAAGIAHDLNNVLSPISLASELLRPSLSAGDDLRLLDTLEGCVTRGGALVKQILGFAHGVSGQSRLVQVKHLVRDIAAMIRATFPKSIVLEQQMPADLWPVKGNPTQIHQVLLNLCVNARDAMPEGGKLRLRAENCVLDAAAARAIEEAQPGAWVMIQVGDTGTGIPPEVAARIWEPFFTTKGIGQGTGLGLSTVRGIVTTHHGFITLSTEVGCGSTFRIYLPAIEDTVVKPANAEAPAPPRGHGEPILVVDDDEGIVSSIQRGLVSCGYHVVTADNGAAAAEIVKARGSELALVITDSDMPVLNGRGLVRIIRTLHPTTKILAISGMGSHRIGDQVERVAFGDANLTKPFPIKLLLKTVADLLHPPPSPASPPEEINGGAG